jgi:antirestriction protein ArdC
MSKEKISVKDIVVDRLLQKINEEGRLPWEKPFQSSSMNWYSKTEYRGINKILLDGGEYITPNQLKEHNEKNKVNYWFESGSPSNIVVFYSVSKRKITEKEAEKGKKDSYLKSLIFNENGQWYKKTFLLKYYRVYNIKYIRMIVNEAITTNPLYKDGVYEKNVVGKNTRLVLTPEKNPILKAGVNESDILKLQKKIGREVVENFTPADEIVKNYKNGTGVKVFKFDNGSAFYREKDDSVFLPHMNNFKDNESFYRVLFHELIHSTGISKRLNRICFKDYFSGSRERGKEEFIAEMGSLLLASEAGFTNDFTTYDDKVSWANNSLNYIAGWCSWMKDNKDEVVNGMIAAEKAKHYILSGGEDINGGSDKSIDNGKTEVVIDSDELE